MCENGNTKNISIKKYKIIKYNKNSRTKIWQTKNNMLYLVVKNIK